MNILNTIISLLTNSSRGNDWMSMFTKKTNQRSGWSIVGYILIGTAIGMITRNSNRTQIMDTTKDFFERIQTQTKEALEPKINLGTVEFGEELTNFKTAPVLEPKKD
ncbi:hypothetical protein [Bacillus pinisoli]|uniref:hypothetical protein n=1 Tax=Bacillus pinisoli TaxID=2901866 RepID=UPI001FF4177C|nr:hypothetical protein [Bacillus pinisoli]